MIKIIKNGSPKTYVAICESCNCEFTYEKSDTALAYPDLATLDSTQSSLSYLYTGIRCPQCSNIVAVDWKEYSGTKATATSDLAASTVADNTISQEEFDKVINGAPGIKMFLEGLAQVMAKMINGEEE